MQLATLWGDPGPRPFGALLMPAGVDQVSAATDGEDCLELITMAGRFDLELAEGP